jgi:hypothetical protein
LKTKNIFSKQGRGQGMVEFAIVFPLLVILIIGIFEVGRVMFYYSVAIAATREAARYGAAIQDTGGGIPQYKDCQGILNSAKRFGKFAGISDADVNIQYSDESGVYSTSCPPSQEIGLTDYISVSINTSISPITPMGSFNAIPVSSSSSRTILRKVELGESGTGAGSVVGLPTDVNFTATEQTAEESKGTIVAVIELNQVATDLVTIPFSITGTALPGIDFTMTPSPVYITPGNTTTTISITLINDGIEEGDETLFIGIDTPTNATRGPQNIHMVKIVDPPFVSFSIADSTKLESDGSTALNIVLSKGTNQNVTVPIVTAGTATWGVSGDYISSPSLVVIPSGSLSTLLSIVINDDLIDEDQEIAALGLGSPTNAVLGDFPMHIMTIIDNDDQPEVMFFTPNQVVSEEIGTFTTHVTLSSVSSKSITVPYSVSGTTVPEDYVINDPSPLVFPPGTQTVGINMTILEGDGWEEDETLILTLNSPTNANVGTPGVQTIVITESSAQPDVFFSSSSQSTLEGDKYIDVYVQMSNAWSSDVVIPYTISGDASNGVGQDYLLDVDTLSIPVGFTQGTIQVEVFDDSLDESDETITLTMGTVVNGTAISPSTHTITILDDDTPPEVNFAISQVDKLETAGPFSVTVTLDDLATQDVIVPLNTSGDATDGTDYMISTSSLVIPAGDLSNSFEITIIDDLDYESDETILIDLGSPTNAVLGSETQFTVNLEDDELPLCEVGTHMLTLGTDSIGWSVTNEGEALVFTGGSVTWVNKGGNKPKLTEVQFSGSTVFSGSEKPTSYSYSSWEAFALLDTTSIQFSFSESLGVGEHTLVGDFQNADDGTPCSLTETFQVH